MAKYIVKKGDTLSGIAKKYYGDYSKYSQLAEHNGIKNANFIRVGQEIEIPDDTPIIKRTYNTDYKEAQNDFEQGVLDRTEQDLANAVSQALANKRYNRKSISSVRPSKKTVSTNGTANVQPKSIVNNARPNKSATSVSYKPISKTQLDTAYVTASKRKPNNTSTKNNANNYRNFVYKYNLAPLTKEKIEARKKYDADAKRMYEESEKRRIAEYEAWKKRNGKK